MYKRYICLTVPGKESRQRVAQWDQDGWAFFLKGKPSHVGWEDRHIDPTLLWCRKHMARFLHLNISSNLTNPQHLCLDLQVRKLWVPSCGFYDSLLSPKHQRQGYHLVWWSLCKMLLRPSLLKDAESFRNIVTPVKNIHILPDARLLDGNARRPHPDSRSLGTCITTEDLRVLNCQIPCSSFHSDILFIL